jgi:hypothetical protein
MGKIRSAIKLMTGKPEGKKAISKTHTYVKA